MARLPQPGPASVKPTRPSFPHIRQYHAIADNDLMTSGVGRFGNALSEFGQYALSASTLLGELNKKIYRPDVSPELVVGSNNETRAGNPNIYGWHDPRENTIALNVKNDLEKHPNYIGDPTPQWKQRDSTNWDNTLIHEEMHAGMLELRREYADKLTGRGVDAKDHVFKAALSSGGPQEHSVVSGILLLKGGSVSGEDPTVDNAYAQFLRAPLGEDDASLSDLVRILREQSRYKGRTNSYLQDGYEHHAFVLQYLANGGHAKAYPDAKNMGLTLPAASDADLKQYLREVKEAIGKLTSMAEETHSRRVSEKIKQVDAEGGR